VRAGDGSWSPSGPVVTPPYAQVDAGFPSQSRPTLVVGLTGEMHVVCYGSVDGNQQILHGFIRNAAFSGWSVVCPTSGDQRHVSAARDAQGRIHMVWREGTVGPDGTASSIAVYYASLDAQGHVEGPLRVSPVGENASTPTVVVISHGVWIAWVAWTPGEVNSEGKRDNGFPSDNAMVEGRLEIRSRISGSPTFGPVVSVDAGRASYPTWALRSDSATFPEALLWTRAQPGSKCRLLLDRVAPP
jgi:hypothetical protein